MIDAAEAAVDFVGGRQRADLDHDRMLLFALVRAIEILGEAASKLSEDARRQGASVPWTAIISMRNRLIHGYFDVDADIIWQTATVELSALLPVLRNLVSQP